MALKDTVGSTKVRLTVRSRNVQGKVTKTQVKLTSTQVRDKLIEDLHKESREAPVITVLQGTGRIATIPKDKTMQLNQVRHPMLEEILLQSTL